MSYTPEDQLLEPSLEKILEGIEEFNNAFTKRLEANDGSNGHKEWSDEHIDELAEISAKFQTFKVKLTKLKSSKSLDISDNIIQVGNVNPSGNGMNDNVFSENGTSNCLTSVQKDNLVVENIFPYRSDNQIDSDSKYYSNAQFRQSCAPNWRRATEDEVQTKEWFKGNYFNLKNI